MNVEARDSARLPADTPHADGPLPLPFAPTGAASARASARLSLLAYANDVASADVIRRAVQKLGIVGAEIRHGDVSDAAAALAKEASPRHLIVDIAGIAQPLSALRDMAQLCEPDVVVLAIGDRDDVALYRALLRDLGVAEYLFKPLALDVVVRLFGPYLTDHRPAEEGFRGGRVVAVAGVHGGAGATTIAVNLGIHLADVARRHVAIVDLDLLAGTSALQLGLRATGGLRQALESPERVDDLFIERTLVKRGERLGLAASEQALDDAFVASPSALGPLLERLRRTHNFIVLDLPGLPAPLRAEALRLADTRILVFEPTLAGARGALRHKALLARDTASHGLVLALNKVGIPGTFARDQLVATAGLEPDVVLPYQPKALNLAAAEGVPALLRSRAFAGAIGKLAADMTAGAAVPVDAGPLAWIKGMLRRQR